MIYTATIYGISSPNKKPAYIPMPVSVIYSEDYKKAYADFKSMAINTCRILFSAIRYEGDIFADEGNMAAGEVLTYLLKGFNTNTETDEDDLLNDSTPEVEIIANSLKAALNETDLETLTDLLK